MSQDSGPPVNFVCSSYSDHTFEEKNPEDGSPRKKCTKCGYIEFLLPTKI